MRALSLFVCLVFGTAAPGLGLIACGPNGAGAPDAGPDADGALDAADGAPDATDGAQDATDGGDGGLDPDAVDGADAAGDPGDGSLDDGADSGPDGGDDSGAWAWIGEACAAGIECAPAGGFCIEDSYPDGMCSLACDRLCPDLDEPGHATTFCITDPDDSLSGLCVSRCDGDLFPGKGCRDGYICRTEARHNEPDVSQPVCLPDDGSGPACTGDEVPQPNAGIEAPPGVDGCPAGMGPIFDSAVCIDLWEAFLEEIDGQGLAHPHSPYFNPGDLRVRAVSAPGAVPQGYINGDQAAAACAEAGKRLCTRVEWELACRGPEQTTYPYGDQRQDGLCNDARAQHPAIEYFGTSADWIWSELGHPCLNQLPDSLALTGDHPACVSGCGAFDLMGNLHEWIADPAGTFKGGFYVDTRINGEGCLYTTTAHNTLHWDYSTGFRCCADR